MTEDHVRQGNWQAMVRANTGSAFIEAGVLLLVGFILSPVDFESVIWRLSSYGVVWIFRVGGLCMLGIGFLCFMSWPRAPLVDAIVSAAIGLVFVVCGAIWIVHKELMGAVILLFGLMSLNSARTSLHTYRSVMAMVDGDGAEELSASAVGDQGSSVSGSGSVTETGFESPTEAVDEPVPDGALAELGRQDDPESTARPSGITEDNSSRKRNGHVKEGGQ